MKNCHFVLAVAREPFGLRVQFVVIRVRKTYTNPDFRGVNPSFEPRAVLHRSGRASFLPRNADFRIGRASFLPRNADFRIGRASFLPRNADFRIGRASFLPRNADFRIGRAVFLPRAELFRIGRAIFLPRAELLRPVGALRSRHRRHRSRRFFSFPTHYIYIRARGAVTPRDQNAVP